jgi:hypothetical protein
MKIKTMHTIYVNRESYSQVMNRLSLFCKVYSRKYEDGQYILRIAFK